MWLPMWVFDGKGFTMACLAVWIRNVAVRWGLSAMTMRSAGWMRRHPTAPVNVARISVATSGTDFTAPEADFAALIPAAASVLGVPICHVGSAGFGTAPGPLLALRRAFANYRRRLSAQQRKFLPLRGPDNFRKINVDRTIVNCGTFHLMNYAVPQEQ